MTFRLLTALFVLLLGVGDALAFGSCRTPGYLAGFDASYGSASCRVVHTTQVRWRGGTADVRVIVADAPTPALDAEIANFRTRVDALVARIGTAMTALGDVRLNETTILLSSLGSGRYHAGTFGGSGECKIIFYKQNSAISLEQFLFTYAHEMFHCVQEATWSRHYDGDEAKWWYEGSAEYFAHLANPNSSQGDRFINAFDEQSPDDALVDMDYAAVVFFLWLGAQRETRDVKFFIDAMPRSAGREAQVSALRARAPIDRWVQFGQDYLDGRIRQPGGRALPSLVNRGETATITGPTRKTLATSEFVLARETLLFKKGKTYRTSIADVRGEPKSRFSVHTGDWADPPARVLACDEDKSFTVLTTAVSGDVASHAFVVEEAQAVAERACCLIGEWTPTPASVQAESRMMMELGGSRMAAAGVGFSCAPAGGGWTLRFGEDSTGAVRWNNFANRCVTRAPRGSMVQTITRRGAQNFTWEILQPGAGRARYTDSSVTWTYVMQIGPQTITRSSPDSGSSIGANGFAYTCTRTTLDIKGIYGLSYREAEYTRPAPAR